MHVKLFWHDFQRCENIRKLNFFVWVYKLKEKRGPKVSTHTLALIALSPIEIILSGMTYYHHWFEEFIKSKNIRVHFFQMKVNLRTYFVVESSQILLNRVWPFELRLSCKKIVT